MSDGRRRRLLWTDDEGAVRFQYAIRCLRRDGWDIEWAFNAAEAAERLATEDFDLLILDLMMPPAAGYRETNVWSGCMVMRWLRGASRPEHAPVDFPAFEGSVRPANVGLPVLLVSAYDDPGVWDAIDEVSRVEQDLVVLRKPLDVDEMRRTIERKVRG